jgi:hypothetical protein
MKSLNVLPPKAVTLATIDQKLLFEDVTPPGRATTRYSIHFSTFWDEFRKQDGRYVPDKDETDLIQDLELIIGMFQ